MDPNKIFNLKDPPNGWKDQLINSAIMAGVAAFTTLASISAAGIRAAPGTSLLAAGIAAGLNFFTSLAIQRGLKKEE